MAINGQMPGALSDFQNDCVEGRMIHTWIDRADGRGGIDQFQQQREARHAILA